MQTRKARLEQVSRRSRCKNSTVSLEVNNYYIVGSSANYLREYYGQNLIEESQNQMRATRRQPHEVLDWLG